MVAIMIVGCYSLELYCENAAEEGWLVGDGERVHEFNEFPHTFTGDRRQDCERAARERGWMINNKTGICLCPKCSGKR